MKEENNDDRQRRINEINRVWQFWRKNGYLPQPHELQSEAHRPRRKVKINFTPVYSLN